MSIDRISNSSSQTYKPHSLLPQGDKVGIFRSNERHYGKTNEAKSPDEVAGTFGDALKKHSNK